MSTRYRITLLALVALMASPTLATETIGKETGLKCTSCHDKAGSRLLTDLGKYYETMGTTDGFEDLTTAFGRCTSCHVRKPGSTKLTKRGKRFAELVGSMEELREWLEERHPMSMEDALLGLEAPPPPVALAPAH